MTPVMRCDDQQPGADGEAKEPNEWVAKANSVQIKAGPIANHRSQILLRAQERLQGLADGHLRCGDNLLWSLHLSLRWRIECADKESAKPPGLNRPARRFSVRSRLERLVHGRSVQRVSARHVIETLRDAPGSFTWLPVALRVAQPAGDSPRILV